MKRFQSIVVSLAALSATASLAGAPGGSGRHDASPLLDPDYAEAILEAPLAMLQIGTPEIREQRRLYLLGLSPTLDKNCDFLSGYTVGQLQYQVRGLLCEVAGSEGERRMAGMRALSSGSLGATTFATQLGCTSPSARKAVFGSRCKA